MKRILSRVGRAFRHDDHQHRHQDAGVETLRSSMSSLDSGVLADSHSDSSPPVSDGGARDDAGPDTGDSWVPLQMDLSREVAQEMGRCPDIGWMASAVSAECLGYDISELRGEMLQDDSQSLMAFATDVMDDDDLLLRKPSVSCMLECDRTGTRRHSVSSDVGQVFPDCFDVLETLSPDVDAVADVDGVSDRDAGADVDVVLDVDPSDTGTVQFGMTSRREELFPIADSAWLNKEAKKSGTTSIAVLGSGDNDRSARLDCTQRVTVSCGGVRCVSVVPISMTHVDVTSSESLSAPTVSDEHAAAVGCDVLGTVVLRLSEGDHQHDRDTSEDTSQVTVSKHALKQSDVSANSDKNVEKNVRSKDVRTCAVGVTFVDVSDTNMSLPGVLCDEILPVPYEYGDVDKPDDSGVEAVVEGAVRSCSQTYLGNSLIPVGEPQADTISADIPYSNDDQPVCSVSEDLIPVPYEYSICRSTSTLPHDLVSGEVSIGDTSVEEDVCIEVASIIAKELVGGELSVADVSDKEDFCNDVNYILSQKHVGGELSAEYAGVEDVFCNDVNSIIVKEHVGSELSAEDVIVEDAFCNYVDCIPPQESIGNGTNADERSVKDDFCIEVTSFLAQEPIVTNHIPIDRVSNGVATSEDINCVENESVHDTEQRVDLSGSSPTDNTNHCVDVKEDGFPTSHSMAVAASNGLASADDCMPIKSTNEKQKACTADCDKTKQNVSDSAVKRKPVASNTKLAVCKSLSNPGQQSRLKLVKKSISQEPAIRKLSIPVSSPVRKGIPVIPKPTRTTTLQQKSTSKLPTNRCTVPSSVATVKDVVKPKLPPSTSAVRTPLSRQTRRENGAEKGAAAANGRLSSVKRPTGCEKADMGAVGRNGCQVERQKTEKKTATTAAGKSIPVRQQVSRNATERRPSVSANRSTPAASKLPKTTESEKKKRDLKPIPAVNKTSMSSLGKNVTSSRQVGLQQPLKPPTSGRASTQKDKTKSAGTASTVTMAVRSQKMPLSKTSSAPATPKPTARSTDAVTPKQSSKSAFASGRSIKSRTQSVSDVVDRQQSSGVRCDDPVKADLCAGPSNDNQINRVQGSTDFQLSAEEDVALGSVDLPDHGAESATDSAFFSHPETSPISSPVLGDMELSSSVDNDVAFLSSDEPDKLSKITTTASDLRSLQEESARAILSRTEGVEVVGHLTKPRRSAISQEEPTSPDGVLKVMSQVHTNSESRLAARRQARVEARQIRMRELERQQQEAELNGERPGNDENGDVATSRSSLSCSRTPRGNSLTPSGSGGPTRRGSGDSMEDGLLPHNSSGVAGYTMRDLRHELRELEEKLRKTMVTSAQLDNDKSTLTYQVELLKDKQEELQEAHSHLQRDHKARCSEHEQLKRVSNRMKEDFEFCRRQLEERDALIAEQGLVLVGDEDAYADSATNRSSRKALVSQSAAELLQKAGEGTLDGRLRRLAEDRNELEDQLRRLKLQLEEERHVNARHRIAADGGGAMDPESDEVQREVSRQVGEYRFKLQKSEQDITNLQTSVQRLENQVQRYKTAAETAEKAEEELKQERRKLQRELRESQNVVEELETTNSHLQKRLDKLKNARSTLLKDLSTE